MPNLIQRLRDSASHYRAFMAPYREIFPGRSVARHVELLTEAADTLSKRSADFDVVAWQGCLDHANKNVAMERANVGIIRNQLFEAREQRDEARADARNAWAELKKPCSGCQKAEAGARANGGFWTGSITVYNEHREPETIVSILDRVQKAEAGEVKMRLEAARALTENAELRKALEASHREIAEARNYWANQGPHDHVIMALDVYDAIVKQRDSAVAERDALEKELTQVCSFVDGKWVRTS